MTDSEMIERPRTPALDELVWLVASFLGEWEQSEEGLSIEVAPTLLERILRHERLHEALNEIAKLGTERRT